FAKTIVSVPLGALSFVRDRRKIGVYTFLDCKDNTYSLVLVDAVASDAIHNAQGHAAKDVVLGALRRALAIDDQGAVFSVPDAAYLWNHPARGFKSVMRVRDATPSERREYLRFSLLK
ncbi:hypothetical protein KC953_01745, partial [Candidatus Saccharibacteria bacterium]|nr:hypothetical protein [Candidatus Saccharibacteria bacterium]